MASWWTYNFKVSKHAFSDVAPYLKQFSVGEKPSLVMSTKDNA